LCENRPVMNPIIWMLIETLGSLFASICVLRAYAWRVHLNPQNPVSEFVNAFSDWLVKPLRRIVKPTRQMDWPSVIAALVAALVVALLFYVLNGRTPSPGPVLLLGLIWLIRWSLYLMMGIIILMAIISLINPYAPLAPALNQLADPILSPIRRVIPLVGNFDLSPLIAILVIQVLLAFIHPGTFPLLISG
jgi:YggT family protein